MQLSVSARSSNLVLIRFIVLEILRFLYFAILAWNCLFTPIYGGFGGTFPPNMVAHRSNPQKALPYAEARCLSHKAWKSVQRFDLGAFPRKKGQDSQTKKSQIGNISPIWGEAPHCTNWNQNLHGGSSRRRNHVCKVLIWYFQGLRFYRGSNFPFPIDFCMGLTTVQRDCAACDVINLSVSRTTVIRPLQRSAKS